MEKTNNKKALQLLAQDIRLAKILAGNNTKLRNITLKKLHNWLKYRTATRVITEDDIMRMWKGLFYTMWMSDKPLIQEECAERIAHLIHLKDSQTSLLFFKCFLQTMVNEWFGIDHHRVDKFLMLVRRVLRQALEVLKSTSWSSESIKAFGKVLSNTVFNDANTTSMGLALHIDEIFLEEVAKVSEGDISQETLIELLLPFAEQLSRTDDNRHIRHINMYVFRHLIEQTDEAIEYKEKFAVWHQRGFPVSSIDQIERVPLEDEEEEENFSDDDEYLGEKPLDPRAGKVHVDLPQLTFDSQAVVTLLERLQFKRQTTNNGRKMIGRLIKQFTKLGKGIYPLGPTKLSTDPSGGRPKKMTSSLKKLFEFEEEISKQIKIEKAEKHKKKNLENSPDTGRQNQDENELEEETNGGGEDFEAFLAKSEGGLLDDTENNLPPSLKSVNKKNRKRKAESNSSLKLAPEVKRGKMKPGKVKPGKDKINSKVENSQQQPAVKNVMGDKDATNREEGTQKNPGKKSEVNSVQNGPKKTTEAKQIPGKNAAKRKEKKLKQKTLRAKMQQTLNKNSAKVPKQEVGFHYSTKKLEDSDSVTKKPENSDNVSQSSGTWQVEKSPQIKTKPTRGPAKSEWNEPLKEGETEIFVMSKKTKKKLKRLAEKKNRPLSEIYSRYAKVMNGKESPKSLNLVKNPFSNQTPKKGEKRIKFALNLNSSQEFFEHQVQVSNSPVIPYDATKKPAKPLLKPSPVPSPINPFYRRKVR